MLVSGTQRGGDNNPYGCVGKPESKAPHCAFDCDTPEVVTPKEVEAVGNLGRIIIHRITVFSKISGHIGYASPLRISRTSMFLHRSYDLSPRQFLPYLMVSSEV